MKKALRLLTSLVLFQSVGLAQGTFQNLGFESASLVAIAGDTYGRVRFDNAFPGWVGYAGGEQQNAALYNTFFTDSSGISIIDGGWPEFYFGSNVGVISGRYTAILQAGLRLGSTTEPADTTLSQSSLVPVSSESLRFRAFTYLFSPFKVFLGGQELNLVALSSTTNYTVYGADIRAWQGQVAKMDFTVEAQRPHVGNSYVFLDSIQFSPVPIPEPGVFVWLGLGALLFSWRCFKKQRT